jgi:hypothetical protein
MKKITIGLFVIVCGFGIVQAQFHEGNVLLSVSGNYQKSGVSTKVEDDMTNSGTKTLNIGLSAGWILKHNFIAGAGLSYIHLNASAVVASTQTDGVTTSRIVSLANIKEHAYVPSVYGKYFGLLTPNLMAAVSFRGSYGLTGVDRNVTSSSQSYIADVNSPGGITSVTSVLDNTFTNYFAADVQPELSYLLTSRLGITLALGGIYYVKHKRQDATWCISFDPSVWTLGFIVRLGK